MNRTQLLTVLSWMVLVGPGETFAQGIPAVSGVLETESPAKVPKGVPPTLSLRASDRPAAFYARCVFGSPAEEVIGESDALPPGQAFVLALPADTKARSAECAVVARFANGLSERKSVTMQWEVVAASPPKTEDADTDAGAAPDDPSKEAPSAPEKQP